jgi:hypothetical protein
LHEAVVGDFQQFFDPNAVVRSTSTAAQDQNARSSSIARSRGLPPAGSWTQILLVGFLVTVRVRVCPAAVKRSPGWVWRAACRSASVVLRRSSTACTRTGRTGSRSRVRASIRDLRCLAALRWLISSSPMGQGATHGPQRVGSSSAHWARSR